MATARKKSSKKTARKSTQSAAKTSSTAASSAASAAARAMRGMTGAFGQFQLNDVAGKLIEGRKRDIDAILEANRKSYQGLQAVVERQTSMLKDSIAQWQSVAKMMSASGPRESFSKLDELAKQSFGMAVANIRELAELSARSQAEAFEVVRQRIRENVEEVTRLLNRM